jgi:hypothetical protein
MPYDDSRSVERAGAAASLQIPPGERLVASVTAQVVLWVSSTVAVFKHQRRAFGFAVVPVTPEQKVRDHRLQRCSLFRQVVFESLRLGLVALPSQDAVFDQVVQPFGEHAAGDAGTGAQLVEAVSAQKDISDDQQRPTLPDHLQGAGDGADLVRVVAIQHDLTILT